MYRYRLKHGRILVLMVGCAMIASACAGESAALADAELPVATVSVPTAVPEPSPLPTVMPIPATDVIDLSGFPEPRYPSFVVPRDTEHEAAGIAAGDRVTDDGIVVALGYSTTRDILVQYDNLVTPGFEFVSAAVSGMDIERWASREVMYPRTSELIGIEVNADGAPADDRVQVLWIQTALAGTADPRVPYVRALINETIRKATLQWPNLQQIYVYGREYGGWVNQIAPDGTDLAGEPGNWSISIAIDLAIADNLDREDGVWVGQGPYFWANGDISRPDGVTWPEDLFKQDGRHLTTDGAAQAAVLLHEYFLEDATASWYTGELTAAADE